MQFNKGLAFTEAERDRLYLRGLLPPAVLSQEVQADRVMQMIRSKSNDLDKHTYLLSLQVRLLLAFGSSLFLYGDGCLSQLVGLSSGPDHKASGEPDC